MVSKAFQEKHGDDEVARKGSGKGPLSTRPKDAYSIPVVATAGRAAI